MWSFPPAAPWRHSLWAADFRAFGLGYTQAVIFLLPLNVTNDFLLSLAAPEKGRKRSLQRMPGLDYNGGKWEDKGHRTASFQGGS